MKVYRGSSTKHGLDMKPIDVEYLFDGSRGRLLLRRRGARGLPRPRPRPRRRVPRAHRHAPDRRARRGAHDRRPRPLRRAAVLRALRRRVPAGLDPHGQGAGPAAQPAEDLGPVRPAHVLPALRVRGVQGLQGPRAQEARSSSSATRRARSSSSTRPRRGHDAARGRRPHDRRRSPTWSAAAAQGCPCR